MASEVATKLQLKAEDAVWIDGDAEQLALLAPLPEGVASVDEARAANVLIGFVRSAAEAEAFAALHRAQFDGARMVWIAYPKAGAADIDRDSLAALVDGFGLRPVRQIAVDATWSALRFIAV